MRLTAGLAAAAYRSSSAVRVRGARAWAIEATRRIESEMPTHHVSQRILVVEPPGFSSSLPDRGALRSNGARDSRAFTRQSACQRQVPMGRALIRVVSVRELRPLIEQNVPGLSG